MSGINNFAFKIYYSKEAEEDNLKMNMMLLYSKVLHQWFFFISFEINFFSS